MLGHVNVKWIGKPSRNQMRQEDLVAISYVTIPRRVRGTFQSLIMDACWKGVMFANKMLSIITERERMYGVIQKPLTEV